MADTDNAPPSIEERHSTAIHTSDMTISRHKTGQADVILAAGLAGHGNRLGSALLYLRGQWDRCDKPAKRSQADIERCAAAIADKKASREYLRRATVQAMVEHAHAMRERAKHLTGRNAVMGMLEEWAVLRGIDCDLLSPALFHWLSPACPACEGTGKKPVLYGQAAKEESCYHCRGTATWPRPPGAQDVHDHIKSCLGKVMGQTARALYG